jgi:hypothetical protein
MADQFAPLGGTPWSRAINQSQIDATSRGPRVPTALDSSQIAVAAAVDPAYQAYSVASNPQAATQESQNRWGATGHFDFKRVGADYWNNPGTALAQDVQSLVRSQNPLAIAAVDTVDKLTEGKSSQAYAATSAVGLYPVALAGNAVGGVAHLAVDETQR